MLAVTTVYVDQRASEQLVGKLVHHCTAVRACVCVCVCACKVKDTTRRVRACSAVFNWPAPLRLFTEYVVVIVGVACCLLPTLNFSPYCERSSWPLTITS